MREVLMVLLETRLPVTQIIFKLFLKSLQLLYIYISCCERYAVA
jgi:hypothetical protein